MTSSTVEAFKGRIEWRPVYTATATRSVELSAAMVTIYGRVSEMTGARFVWRLNRWVAADYGDTLFTPSGRRAWREWADATVPVLVEGVDWGDVFREQSTEASLRVLEEAAKLAEAGGVVEMFKAMHERVDEGGCVLRATAATPADWHDIDGPADGFIVAEIVDADGGVVAFGATSPQAGRPGLWLVPPGLTSTSDASVRA